MWRLGPKYSAHKFQTCIPCEVTFEPAISASPTSDLYHLISGRPHALLGHPLPGPQCRRIIQAESRDIKGSPHSWLSCHGLCSHTFFCLISAKHIFYTIFLAVYSLRASPVPATTFWPESEVPRGLLEKVRSVTAEEAELRFQRIGP